MHAVRLAKKKEQPESPELATKLKQEEAVKATRALISPYLSGSSTPRAELDALVKRAIRDRD